MHHTMKMVAVLAMSASLAACADQGFGANKTTGGGLVGAGLGGLAGSQLGGGSGKLATTAIGVLLGALAGSNVGQSLDRADHLSADRTAGQVFEQNSPGQGSTWSNPDTGHHGTITPTTRMVEQPSGQVCREFQQTIVVGGQTQQGVGTACRQPDGTWRVVSG
jgi:surface antigen